MKRTITQLLATACFLSWSSASADAQVLSLHCSGTNQGSNIQTSYEPIDIRVSVLDGSIFGFPTYKAPGCGDLSARELKVKNDVTDDLYQTKCKNSIATSTTRLNRYSGALSIDTFFHKEKDGGTWMGRYMCKEQKKKF
jgi:hypothetical protein